jgi:hypothetical protein
MGAAGLQTATVIDFTSYRARRARPTASDPTCFASSSGAMLAFWPVMFPVVAWVPVWQTPPGAWREESQ